jgi:ribosomal protein S27E
VNDVSEQALWLDGNAIAGLLNDVFGTELTATRRGCQSCGALTCIGAHRVYRGAGTVVRCPVCGDLALRVTSMPDRYVVLLAGTWALEMPRG